MNPLDWSKLKWLTSSFDYKEYLVGVVTLCPHCNTAITPVISSQFCNETYAFLIQECNFCKNIYFSIAQICNEEILKKVGPHEYYNKYNPQKLNIYKTVKVYPEYSFKNYNLPENIINIYPEFAEIFQQAEKAEEFKLDKICGVAYRKSLEILVKQCLALKFPNNKDEIYSETLSKSISRFQNLTIQRLAKAATWLGNDETHMIRKHTDYDINDMKKFINALVHTLEAEYIAEYNLDEILNKPK